MNKQLLAALAAAALLMTACGGGSDSSPSSPVNPPGGNDPTPVAETPPDSASTAEGFTAYLEALAAKPSDTAEAVDLSKFLPPKSETAEPTPVN